MRELPIPSSPHGWVCAGILLLILFFGYYRFLFPELHTFYFEEKPGYPAFYSRSESKCMPLEIQVYSPRQIAPFGKRWVYVKIKNDSDSPITVTVSLSVTPSLPGWYLPFLFGSSISDIASLSFSPLPPYATAYGRIPLFSTQTISDARLYVLSSTHTISDTTRYVHEKCFVTIAQPPMKDEGRYFVHAFVEQLLLPPWSNWILAALALLIPALVEPKGSTKLSLQLLIQMFGLSLGLSLAFVAGALVAASAIWWPVEKEAGGGWNIIIIIVSIILIILFVWRSLDVGLPQWLTEWLQKQRWLQPVRNRLQQKWLRSLIVPAVLILVGVALMPLRQLFPLLRPLGGMFIVMGALECLRTILCTIHPQESGGRNESGSNRGGPEDASRDKSES